MSKSYYRSLFLFSIALSTNAFAVPVCSSDPQVTATTDPSITTVLSGSTVCTSDSQEQHRSGGELWDYKMGPSDPTDPTSQVGTWQISGDTVIYNYGGPDYTFTLHKQPGTTNDYMFCGPSNVTAIINNSITSCP